MDQQREQQEQCRSIGVMNDADAQEFAKLVQKLPEANQLFLRGMTAAFTIQAEAKASA